MITSPLLRIYFISHVFILLFRPHHRYRFSPVPRSVCLVAYIAFLSCGHQRSPSLIISPRPHARLIRQSSDFSYSDPFRVLITLLVLNIPLLQSARTESISHSHWITDIRYQMRSTETPCQFIPFHLTASPFPSKLSKSP